MLWETRVSGGPCDGTVWRYTSAADALAGHEVLVNTIMETEAGLVVRFGNNDLITA